MEKLFDLDHADDTPGIMRDLNELTNSSEKLSQHQGNSTRYQI